MYNVSRIVRALPGNSVIVVSDSTRGIVLGGEELRVLANAFDIAFIFTSQNQVGEVAKLARHFCRFSTDELNLAKSEGCCMGEWDLMPRSLFGALWTDTIERYLGVNLALGEPREARWRHRLTAAEAYYTPLEGASHIYERKSVHINVIVYTAVLNSAGVTSIDAQ